jgi:protease YdgD
VRAAAARLAVVALLAVGPWPAWAQGKPGRGGDSCRWANDLQCDEPGIGTGACSRGTDASDCRALAAGGDDSCRWARDGECDEPGIGTGNCADGTDLRDCRALYPRRNRDNACPTAFDGTCQEAASGGDGRCEARTDTADCLGRDQPDGFRDHFFGRDDRVRLPPEGLPWTAIGEITFADGSGCTGTLVTAQVVLTAAHCFFGDDGRPVRPTSFQAGLHGDRALATARIVRHAVADGFDPRRHGEDEGLDARDYAFAALDRPIGKTVGTVPWHRLTDEDVRAISAGRWLPLSQAGYSWDSPTRLTGHLGCRIASQRRDGVLLHECDTTHGDSGSPLMAEIGGRLAVVALDSRFADPAKRGGRSRNLAVDSRAWADALERFVRGGGR